MALQRNPIEAGLLTGCGEIVLIPRIPVIPNNLRFNREFLQYGISRTNLFFAGLSHLPDYVVSVSGTLDPYFDVSPGSDPSKATNKAPVYVLQNQPRCTALGAFEDSPTEAIRQLRMNVMNDIHYFIQGVPFAGATRVLSSVVLVIGVIIAFTL
ncbi:unnamed protein product [Diatraea saccharalis]|uniref:Uncharacterized protein n=1 Tax=Diatraea saccharalis TaxID=40085 RepID=A0A9N9R4K4_9NEOP|nr:unnamed protein product [Diatraea saccharalis]